MGESGVGTTGRDRFLHALAGERVAQVVTGLTFVDPSLLGADPGAPDAPPAGRLVRAGAREGLDFAFVPSWEPWAAEACASLTGAGIGCAWVVPGVLWPALEATGVATGLRAAAAGPDALAEPLDDALEHALHATRSGLRAGAAAIVVADDLAGSSGPLVDPAFLRAAVFPRLAAVTATASDAEVPAVLHSDGDIRTLMSATAVTGFVAVHGDSGGGRWFEESVRPARAAGLAVIGGLPTALLSDEATAVAAAEAAGVLASGGGLLVADDGGVTTPAEAAHLLLALRAARTASGAADA